MKQKQIEMKKTFVVSNIALLYFLATEFNSDRSFSISLHRRKRASSHRRDTYLLHPAQFTAPLSQKECRKV